MGNSRDGHEHTLGEQPSVRAPIVRGTARLYSIFRQGLRYWLDLVGTFQPVFLGLFFAPDKLLT